MDAQQFLAEFEHIANAPGGMAQLKDLVLQLGIQGKLLAETSPRTRTSLGELGNWGSGGTPSKTHVDYYGGDIPWLVIGDLTDGLVTTAATSITRKGLENSSAKLIPPGSLLVGMYGSIGKLGITTFECTTNQAIAHCVVNEKLAFIRYLFIFIRANRSFLFSQGKGLAQQNISQTILKATLIDLPDLEEQSRIVAKVDELMALCDKLEAQQQARRKLQNALRQSSLQAVANSQSPHELQTTWARLADNFGRLFHAPEDLIDLDQCIKQLALKGLLSVWAEGEMVNSEIAELTRVSTASVPDTEMDWPIPDHWVWARCAWLGEARLGKMLDAAKNKGGFRPYLRNINVRWGRFDLSDVLQMRIEEHELSKVSVRKGDLVICEGGEPGRAAVWSREEEFVIQKALHRFRCNEHVLPEYILFCLEHDYFSGRLSRYFTGATIKHLTGRALAEYPIPLPPVDEQKRILVAANELMHSVATLKERLIAGNRCAAALAAASVASLTGIAIEQEE